MHTTRRVLGYEEHTISEEHDMTKILVEHHRNSDKSISKDISAFKVTAVEKSSRKAFIFDSSHTIQNDRLDDDRQCREPRPVVGEVDTDSDGDRDTAATRKIDRRQRRMEGAQEKVYRNCDATPASAPTPSPKLQDHQHRVLQRQPESLGIHSFHLLDTAMRSASAGGARSAGRGTFHVFQIHQFRRRVQG